MTYSTSHIRDLIDFDCASWATRLNNEGSLDTDETTTMAISTMIDDYGCEQRYIIREMIRCIRDLSSTTH